MATISDDFNRANSSSLGSNWTEDSGDWQINTNVVIQATTGNSYRKCRWVGSSLSSNNYDVEGDVESSSTIGFGIFGRGVASSTVTYYGGIYFGADNVYIVEITGGGESVLGSGPGHSGVGYNLRLRCDGSALELFVNDSSEVTASDGTLTSGSVGLMVYGGQTGITEFVDNFLATDLASDPVKSARMLHPVVRDNRRVLMGV